MLDTPDSKVNLRGLDLKEVPYQYRITVSIGPEDIERDTPEIDILDFGSDDLNGGRIREIGKELNAVPVNWMGDLKDFKRLGQKHGKHLSYVISAVDSSNKVSENYSPCLGVVVIGSVSYAPSSNVSLLLHSMPMDMSLDSFKTDLTGCLAELKLKSLQGTVDAIIFGGNNKDDGYKRAIRNVVEVVQGTLGIHVRVFEPAWAGATDVAVDTEHRRVHMMRATRQVFTERIERPGNDMMEGNIS